MTTTTEAPTMTTTDHRHPSPRRGRPSRRPSPLWDAVVEVRDVLASPLARVAMLGIGLGMVPLYVLAEVAARLA